MRRTLFRAFAVASVISLATTPAFASSTPLAPNGTVVPGTNLTAPGTVEAAFTASASNPNVSVTEYAVKNDGVFDFYYLFSNQSTDTLVLFDLFDYTGYSTAVANETGSVNGTAAGTDPSFLATRSSSGDSVAFDVRVLPGASTEWLEVDTNATEFSSNGSIVISGLTSLSSPVFGALEPAGPVAAPEPVTLALLAGGLAVLAITRRRGAHTEPESRT